MHYVYVLRLVNGTVYTGSTSNLKRRLQEHVIGKSKTTKKLRPVKLAWYGAFSERLVAKRFEVYLKSGSGQAFRNKHFIIKV
jgi:predicted GIY-YIG superfamily endonuclease